MSVGTDTIKLFMNDLKLLNKSKQYLISNDALIDIHNETQNDAYNDTQNDMQNDTQKNT